MFYKIYLLLRKSCEHRCYYRQNNLSGAHTTRNIQSDETEGNKGLGFIRKELIFNDFSDKEAFVVDEEDDLDVFLQHSTSVSSVY